MSMNIDRMFTEKPTEKGVRVEVLVSAQTAANIEALETCYCRWKAAYQAKDKAGEAAAMEVALRISNKDPQALAIHVMRPPSLFMPKPEAANQSLN